jgi:hypothetical protein
MTTRADHLTRRAKTADHTGSVRSYPASSVRVFVDALERLDYCIEPLLAGAGFHRADLDDSDALLLEGRDTPLSAEFAVTLSLRLFREETEAGFAPPTRASATSRMMLERWNGCSVARCTQERPGTVGLCRAKHANFRSGAVTPF